MKKKAERRRSGKFLSAAVHGCVTASPAKEKTRRDDRRHCGDNATPSPIILQLFFLKKCTGHKVEPRYYDRLERILDTHLKKLNSLNCHR